MKNRIVKWSMAIIQMVVYVVGAMFMAIATLAIILGDGSYGLLDLLK